MDMDMDVDVDLVLDSVVGGFRFWIYGLPNVSLMSSLYP